MSPLLAARFAAAVVLVAAVARGEEAAPPAGTRVDVLAPPCVAVPYDRARLLSLLRVELAPLDVTEVALATDASGASEGAAAVVMVAPFTCDPATSEVALTIADRATKKTVSRRLALSDVDAPVRPRVLAIAIAELLSTSWVEFALAPAASGEATPGTPGVPPAVPENAQRALALRLVPAVSAVTPKDTHGETNQRPPARWSLHALGLARVFPARSTAVLGGAAGASYAFDEHVVGRLSAELAFGDADVAVGTIDIKAATASLGVAYRTAGAAVLEFEPHLALGAGWARGHANADSAASGRTYSNFLGLAALTAAVRVRAGRFEPFAAVEIGYTFASVSFLVSNQRAAGLGGAILGARIGSDFDL